MPGGLGVHEPGGRLPVGPQLVQSGAFQEQPAQEGLVLAKPKSDQDQRTEEQDFEPAVRSAPGRETVSCVCPKALATIDPGTRPLDTAHVMGKAQSDTALVSHHAVGVPDRKIGPWVFNSSVREI